VTHRVPSNKRLGQAIRETCAIKGLTLSEASLQLGLKPNAMSRWAGGIEPKAESYGLLMKFLGVELSQLGALIVEEQVHRAGVSPKEVSELVYAPRTVYAPDGTPFTLQLVFDPPTMKQVFNNGETSYELRGPGDKSHLWLANRDGYILEDPSHDDVPQMWTVMARLALMGRLEMDAAAEEGT
jgi:transcriptional regulator with XRE-family HTH domain